MNYSISLNGISAAEQNFSQAAKRTAAGGFPDPADMVQAVQAKTAVEANLKVISTEQEIYQEGLNLLA